MHEYRIRTLYLLKGMYLRAFNNNSLYWPFWRISLQHIFNISTQNLSWWWWWWVHEYLKPIAHLNEILLKINFNNWKWCCTVICSAHDYWLVCSQCWISISEKKTAPNSTFDLIDIQATNMYSVRRKLNPIFAYSIWRSTVRLLRARVLVNSINHSNSWSKASATAVWWNQWQNKRIELNCSGERVINKCISANIHCVQMTDTLLLLLFCFQFLQSARKRNYFLVLCLVRAKFAI